MYNYIGYLCFCLGFILVISSAIDNFFIKFLPKENDIFNVVGVIGVGLGMIYYKLELNPPISVAIQNFFKYFYKKFFG